MVDDFMVCVDRIIASACLERPQTESPNSVVVGLEQVKKRETIVSVSVNESNGDGEMVVECRICQEEDQVRAMEAPCACNGTLKFAHRKCIQRWCNKKGDITCEICNQLFSPNYSVPPARRNPDVMTIDIRHAWGAHIDLHDSHLLALAAAEGQFLQSEYEDYAVAITSSIACLRSVALILLIVWLTRQVLMATRDSGMLQESSKFFNFQVSLLQFAGFLLPCYVMARSLYIMQSRRRRQGFFMQH